MQDEPKPDQESCPVVVSATVETQARQAFEDVLPFCTQDDGPFRPFETNLLRRLFALGCLLVRLFLLSRHERLLGRDLTPPPGYRPGDPQAERTLKTLFGPVTYQHAQLLCKQGGEGYPPLDVELGLTRDGFSPWVIQFVTRLATRRSFAASRLLCRAVLGWSPSTEAIEHLVLGLGRQAQPFMQHSRTGGRRRRAGDRGGRQVPADGTGRRVAETAWSAGAARAGLCLRLPTASWPGQAPAAGQQETPAERGQKQEWQGSGTGGDVHLYGVRMAGCTGR